jgi:hypothetical protein
MDGAVRAVGAFSKAELLKQDDIRLEHIRNF